MIHAAFHSSTLPCSKAHQSYIVEMAYTCTYSNVSYLCFICADSLMKETSSCKNGHGVEHFHCFILLYYDDVTVFVFSLERRFVAQERNIQNSAAENKRYILGIPEQPRISQGVVSRSVDPNGR